MNDFSFIFLWVELPTPFKIIFPVIGSFCKDIFSAKFNTHWYHHGWDIDLFLFKWETLVLFGVNCLHFVTYSKNNISETCQDAKLRKLRGLGKCVMIDCTATLEKSCSFDYDTNNGSEI